VLNSSNEKKFTGRRGTSASPLGKQTQRREAGVASVVLVFASIGIGWEAPHQMNSVEWYSAHVEAREVELERCGALPENESRDRDQNCINANQAKQILDGLVRIGGPSIREWTTTDRATQHAAHTTIEAGN